MTTMTEDNRFKIAKRVTPFINTYFTEKWDVEKLIKILYRDDIINNNEEWNERTMMNNALSLHFKKKSDIKPFTKKFLSHVYHNRYQLLHATIRVKYLYKKTRPFSRVYPEGSVGLCQIRRQIRHTMCNGVYVDIDLVNAHPDILNQLFKNKYPMLNEYVNDREKYFNFLCDHYATFGMKIEYNTPRGRDLCKGFFIQNVLYNGDYKNWARTKNIGKLEEHEGHELFTPYPEPDFYNTFKSEMKEIGKILINENPILSNDILKERIDAKKHENTQGSIISWFCGEYERRTLEVIYDVLKSEKLIKKNNVVLCFDGLMILENELFNTEENQQSIMAKCELEIYKKLNISLKLKVKEFDEQLDDSFFEFCIPEENEIEDIVVETTGVSKEMCDFYDEMFKIDGIETRLGIAELVNALYPKHFIYNHDEWYGWERKNNKWNKSVNPLNLCIMYDIRDYLKDNLEKHRKNVDQYKGAVIDKFILLESKIKEVLIKSLCNPFEWEYIVKASKTIMVDNEMQFDGNRNLFGCKNGVFDIEADIFRPYKFDDFVTMNCGYDYEELREGKRCRELTQYDMDKFEDIHKIMKQVFSDKDVRNLVMKIYGSGVSGKCIEKFFVFNGQGGNGKGLLDEFLRCCLGDYFYEADITLLTTKKKGGNGPCQELADIDKKRFLLYKEPGQYVEIENSNMKDQTGGGVIKGRALYSSKTTVELHNTTVMECNQKPKLKETPTTGDARRICDILFQSTFTTNKEDVNEENHVYLANPLLKEDTWKNDHKVYFLNLLFESVVELKKEKYVMDIFIPDSVKRRSDLYLLECFDIHDMFIDHYEYTSKNEFISLREVVATLKVSTNFHSLSKVKQRGMKNEMMYDFFRTNPGYKNNFKERHDYMENGTRVQVRNILLNYKRKDVFIDESI